MRPFGLETRLLSYAGLGAVMAYGIASIMGSGNVEKGYFLLGYGVAGYLVLTGKVERL